MRNDDALLRLHASDNVVISKGDMQAGTEIPENGTLLNVTDAIPFGHKVATAAIAKDEAVRKYGQIIGFATRDIAPGEHVHEHNLVFAEFARDYEFGADATPTDFIPEAKRATFQGIVRADGHVATRNYLAVITSVNCSATVARYICDHFRGPALDAWPNVDGVIALSHGSGCGTASHGDGWDYLRRCIAGYSEHPNIAGTLLLGLGCEINQIDSLVEDLGLTPRETLHTKTIQDMGGTNASVREGIACIEAMLPAANEVTREAVPASHIILGMECGGSDAFSGVTANPALGSAADLLVRHGGTAILGETPEIYGAEHLLIRRAASEAVGRKLLDRISWWEDYTKKNGAVVDNNPTPGNKAGGLTTILEKSLGAAAKGGTSNLVEVYRYGEPVTSNGFVFMDTPGYDPVSITGMVAGGANVVCFTTGRGSVFGCKPTPSLKLATNSEMFSRMHEDMDINCGRILDGEADIESLGREIFELILRTASGEPSKSEAFGFGDEEFVPWQVGAVL
ncbi:MAG: altronate dehydratase family protein [Alphaproteobacteria bacterium]